MIRLNEEHVATLIAFLDSFDLALTGAWPAVEAAMRDEFEIENPEADLAAVREALSA